MQIIGSKRPRILLILLKTFIPTSSFSALLFIRCIKTDLMALLQINYIIKLKTAQGKGSIYTYFATGTLINVYTQNKQHLKSRWSLKGLKCSRPAILHENTINLYKHTPVKAKQLIITRHNGSTTILRRRTETGELKLQNWMIKPSCSLDGAVPLWEYLLCDSYCLHS